MRTDRNDGLEGDESIEVYNSVDPLADLSAMVAQLVVVHFDRLLVQEALVGAQVDHEMAVCMW